MTKLIAAVAFLILAISPGFAAKDTTRQIGVAKIDITPDYPVRLNGYLSRQTESQGVAQRIYAKAIAIGSDKEQPAILITVDNCIVPRAVRDELVARLKKKAGINPDRVALAISHTHSAPCLTDAAPNIFGKTLTPEEQAQIDRYTREFIDYLEKVSLAALKDRRAGNLAWAQGSAGFAANRRTKGGPVDHDLPILVATDTKGKLRAVVANYACHCTTLGGEFNEICGDWAGYAQEYIERDNPGAIALMAIGCGADANPSPRPGLDAAKAHGQSIATEVKNLLANPVAPLKGKLECHTKDIKLPFDTHPTREQFAATAKQDNANGYHARKNLERLDRGEKLQTELPYLVQTWNFGNDLAMVFLPGEVVVDYSLRLKKEFDASRLWVSGYANDVPCYIPSKRIWTEGGYEGGGAMIYYDRPTRLASNVEELIIKAVHEIMPKQFLFDEKKSQFPPPKSPEESLAYIRTKPGFKVELVASEPLIVDPVAIDWGADKKLWVVEMHDYPSGMDGNWKPGGRVKFLEDTNGDGKYDKSTLFVDGIPFPTGVMAWKKGALICTAPDILYAEDTTGDGRADIIKKVFSGFITENYQARVNSLSYGLDNWVYGANGLLGGTISGIAGGNKIDIRGRDFRMHPDEGIFEPASGLTQQGRIRDDWDNWFGCDNSTPAWYYPIADRYVRRNPYVIAPSPRLHVATGPDATLIYPISRLLERFNMPQSANRVTSGCGLGMYRDDLLGAAYYGDLFLCEPVHNLVHRIELSRDGAVVSGKRAKGDESSEFLASKDNWFRPVQARTGPDGALYVVDMYRFVIEHPRWIPAERLAELNVRAGDDKGRIYRVYPANQKLREVPNLKKLSTFKLVSALNTPNGTQRDLIQQELVQRNDKASVRPLEVLAGRSTLPAVRAQALWTLQGMNALHSDAVNKALTDTDSNVRAQAIRLSEPLLKAHPASVTSALLKLINDPEFSVRYQLALSLGEWDAPEAAQALGRITIPEINNAWIRAAILSSARNHPAEILAATMTINAKNAGRAEMIDRLISTAVGQNKPEVIGGVLAILTPPQGAKVEDWQFSALKSLLDALARNKSSLAKLSNSKGSNIDKQLQPIFDAARKVAADSSAQEPSRDSAIRLLGQQAAHQKEDLELLATLLKPGNSLRIQKAALDTLKRQSSADVPKLLLSGWKTMSPSLRNESIEILLSRDDFMRQMLSAVEAGTLQKAEISAANRQRLLKHNNEQIQKQAAALLGAGEQLKRAEVISRYKDVATITGDIANGRALFVNNCASCHALRGQGFGVGPNLVALADKPVGDWLLAILDPNAIVEPRYVSYNIETRDDRSLSGIVSAETGTTLTLIMSGGLQEQILKSDITEIRATGLSLMPEGFEDALTPQAMADLISFIKTAPVKFGSASPEKASQARASFAGTGTPVKTVSAGERVDYPSWMGILPMEHCRQTDGKSKLVWQSVTPQQPAANGMYEFRFPVAMGFVSNPAGRFQLLLNDVSVLDFDVSLDDRSWQSKDGQAHLNYTVMENNEEDSNGVLTISLPASRLEAGKSATFSVIGSASQSQRWFGIYQVKSSAQVSK